MKRLVSKLVGGGAAVVGSSLAFATTVAAQRYSYDYTFNSADAAAATGLAGMAYGLNFLMLCCFCCIPVILSIVLFIFVYKDTQKYNIENGIIWAILAFTWVGLLIYLLAVRPDAVREFEKKHPHNNSNDHNSNHSTDVKKEEVKDVEVREVKE